LQSSSPPEQDGLHNPPRHCGVATPADEQARVHEPQLAVVLLRSVSQPSVLAPLFTQSSKPDLQLNAHCIAGQLALSALMSPHETPHAPQLPGVVSEVSQPSVLAPLFTQSPDPPAQV